MIVGAPSQSRDNGKIKLLIEKLFANNDIIVADKKARPYTKYERYNFRSVMYAFTNNKGFDYALLNPIDIEDYFTFALTIQ